MRNLIKLAAVFAAVIIFFLGYNTYILDRSLENLKYSLDAVSTIETAEGAGDVSMLMDYNVLREIAGQKLNPEKLANLEYAKTVMASGASGRKLEDVEYMLNTLVEDKLKERGAALNVLDSVVRFFGRASGKVARLLYIFKKKKSTVVDSALLEEARSHESSWKFPEAAAAYEKFIAKNKDYEKIGSIRLHLGFSYQMQGRFPDAEKVYSRVAREFAGKNEGMVAAKLLGQISETKALFSRKRELLLNIKDRTISAGDLQNTYYELGLVNIQLCEFDAAYDCLNEAVRINGRNELADKSRFVTAWLYKHQKKLEQASRSFEEVIKASPAVEMLISAKYELADLSRLKGDYAGAIAGYKEIAEDYKDNAVAALAQYQVGTTYFYDLGDVEAATQAFDELKDKYPDSGYVTKGIKQLKEFGEKEKTLSSDYHPIIVNWIEKITPDTLARFAGAIKEFATALKDKETAQFTATYDSEELNAFLNRHFANILPEQIIALVVVLDKDSVAARGNIKLRILPFKFYAKGKLTVSDKKPRVLIDDLIVNDIPVPKILLNEMAREINIVLRSEYFPLEFEEIAILDGKLVVKGRIPAQ
ncbi:MAG: tetratricopeptide repeat protein [Candidatus Omnitrophota bacterium]